MSNNLILDDNNQILKVTNFLDPAETRKSLAGLPLTTSDGTATGAVCIRTKESGASPITNYALESGGNLEVIAQRTSDANDFLNTINTAISKLYNFSYVNITTSTTTTIFSATGYLHTITINKKGTVASTVIVYDSLTGSGTTIATIDSLTPLGNTFTFDLRFDNGLTIVTTGAPDITVTYQQQ